MTAIHRHTPVRTTGKGREAGRQAGRQAGRHAGRQAGRDQR